MRHSLRVRLMVILIGLAIVPLLVVGGIIARNSFTVQQAQALELQSQVAKRVATDVAAFIKERESELRLLTDVQKISQLEREQQTSLLAKSLFSQDVYKDLALINGQGEEVIRISRKDGTTAPDKLGTRVGADEFEIPKNRGETYYSTVHLDAVTDEPLMTIAVPLIDLGTGEFSGVLVANFRFITVWRLTSSARIEGKRLVYVIDTTGLVIAHPNQSVVLQNTRFVCPTIDGFYSGLDGAPVALASERIQLGVQTFTVVAEQPEAEALSFATSTVYTIIIIIVAALVVASAVGVLAARQIVHPIDQLATTARAISRGDLSQQVAVRGHDEIGNLASTFNDMTRQLRQTMSDLERNEARFRSIIDSIPIGMYMYQLREDGALTLQGVNPVGQRILELDVKPLIGKPFEDAFPDLVATELPARYRAAAAEGLAWQTERAIYASDQTHRVYEVYAFQTAPGNMVAAYLDITERKHAAEEHERLQQEVIAAQQRAIAELSTPVIPVMEGVIVLPLIGSIDTMRARDITRALLAGITQHQAKVVILDVTGVSLMDTSIVNHLNKTIQAARLKGAQTIVTGMSDAVAEAIVDLGIDWSHITTLSDLQSGLTMALHNLGFRLDKKNR